MTYGMRVLLESSTMDYRTVFDDGEYLIAEYDGYRIYCSGASAMIQFGASREHVHYTYPPAFATAIDRMSRGVNIR